MPARKEPTDDRTLGSPSGAPSGTESPPAGFFAYASNPIQIGQTVKAAITQVSRDRNAPRIAGWEQNDIAGRFLIDPILSRIEESDFLVADITRLNFNVVFEIGYAIGREKRIVLVRNASITANDDLVREVGLFDTLGYKQYSQSSELVDVIKSVSDLQAIPTRTISVHTGSPVYVVLPRIKTDVEVRLIGRLKKARLQFRSFDPEEQGRMSAQEAIENVAQSHGVVMPLLPRERQGAEVHNFRAAFVAGLTMALERSLLLLQGGDDPVPLDYRDLVESFRFPSQIDQYVADFASEIGERFQTTASPLGSQPLTLLEQLSLGASAAENELPDLANYYLETDEYRRAVRGELRIVSGRKGAGKTALFAQLRDKVRRDKTRLVLDLKPEGFQLLKLRERNLSTSLTHRVD
jgi:nucleoside 2-deoxyribosyltransferase